jgi:uncharacterized membrane protein YdfJ with MMPL/SSD domain
VLGGVVFRHRRRVAVAWAVALLVLAPLAPGLQGTLAAGGFTAQSSEAVRTADIVATWLPGRARSQLVVVSPTGDVARLRRAVALVRTYPHVLHQRGAIQIVRSPRGRAAFASFGLDIDPDMARSVVQAFRTGLARQGGSQVEVTGRPAVFQDIETATAADLRRAETVGVPAALVVLVLAFGTAVAAGVPLVVGGIAVVITLGLLFLLASAVPLSIFVLNITTMLGLGVGVDYALLTVSRFREELRAVDDVGLAVERTVATAGRAIAFSAIAVLIGLSGLWLFGLRVLSSLAVGGSLVVFVSALAALTLLPALLGMLGRRVDRAPVLPRRFRRGGGDPRWAALADTVMNRPWLVIGGVLTVIGVLALPAFSATLNVPRAGVLPAQYASRRGEQVLDTQFSQQRLNPIIIAVARGVPLPALERRVASVPGVAGVVGPGQVPAPEPGTFTGPSGSVIEVTPAVNPFSNAARRLVDRLRALPGHGTDFWVTGETAGEHDFLGQIRHRAPWAIAAIMLAIYVALAVAFRSALLPLKAIVMNTLSVAATFGVLVWVFQDGNLNSLLGVSPVGHIDPTLPVVLFSALFGISMDYEVFMLSRIAEARRGGAGNREAVAVGLVATGKIITSAAAIIVVIGLAFTTADVVIVKEIGLGLAIAVSLDATLIRSLLVPATMRVLGDGNWWPGGYASEHSPIERAPSASPGAAVTCAGGAKTGDQIPALITMTEPVPIRTSGDVRGHQ